jgi:hypothetical protein
MSTSQDDQIDQLVQARWRAIGLSQADLAEILCSGASLQKNGVDGAVKVDSGRLATVAEMLGIAADMLNRRPAATAQPQGGRIAAVPARAAHAAGVPRRAGPRHQANPDRARRADRQAPGHAAGNRLKRDEIRLNRHRALDSCLSMIFSENRFALFRIML